MENNVKDFELGGLEENLSKINNYFDGFKEDTSWKEIFKEFDLKKLGVALFGSFGLSFISGYGAKKMLCNPFNKINENTKNYIEKIIDKVRNSCEVENIGESFDTIIEMVKQVSPLRSNLDSLISDINGVKEIYSSNLISNDLLINSLEYFNNQVPHSSNESGLALAGCSMIIDYVMIAGGISIYKQIKKRKDYRQSKMDEVNLFREKFIDKLDGLPSSIYEYFTMRMKENPIYYEQFDEEVKDISDIYYYCSSVDALKPKFEELMSYKLNEISSFKDYKNMEFFVLND